MSVAVSAGGAVGPSGRIGLQVIRPGSWMTDDLRYQVENYRPGSDLGRVVKAILSNGLSMGAAEELFEAIARTVVIESCLRLRVLRHPDSPFADPRGGRFLIEDYGVVSRRVVTTAGVNYLAGSFRNLQEPETLNFHALGTGVAAEATADTALGTEWAGADYTSSVRATGTQSGPSANVYRSLGTNTKASAGTSAVTEHGLVSSATPAAGTLWDRSVFSAVNLAQNDSLQATYDGTFAAGG
jgi:hypothetical protein